MGYRYDELVGETDFKKFDFLKKRQKAFVLGGNAGWSVLDAKIAIPESEYCILTTANSFLLLQPNRTLNLDRRLKHLFFRIRSMDLLNHVHPFGNFTERRESLSVRVSFSAKI